jgi:hypothetical protein
MALQAIAIIMQAARLRCSGEEKAAAVAAIMVCSCVMVGGCILGASLSRRERSNSDNNMWRGSIC